MTHTSLNNVSIRLKSGGHSFSAEAFKAAIADTERPAEVVLLTAKSTLVPAEFFEKAHAATYLADVGLAPSMSECAVYSKPTNGIVAVMAISKSCYEAIHEIHPAGVICTSPLLPSAADDGISLYLEDDLLYIHIYTGGLLFAEVMECMSDADILYYLATINEVYNIYNKNARAMGDTARIKRVCKRVFKELICE